MQVAERKDDDSKLDEGSENFECSVEEAKAGALVAGKVAQPCLKVNNEKHATVEAEGGVSGEERESSLL